ncbi:histone-lysine N-methyltransferase SETMAR [Plakobranchus ocellatus]|uniref:Histone-lysine N-methyltransferase SETMAR n=1 Tax=Plakobranchus ocellatus TaxID=259542 RepID=A0AAV3ZER9_9GAST|nr:histone-lysine N-methyltransferase SETMAR [Plakobranchus ocellatus]
MPDTGSIRQLDAKEENWRKVDRPGVPVGIEEKLPGKVRFDIDANVEGNVNNNYSDGASCVDLNTRKISQIEVVKSCRVEESEGNRSNQDFVSGSRGANNNNNISCSQVDMALCSSDSNGMDGVMEFRRNSRDSSNNNKCLSEQFSESCKVDNLVMEANQMASASKSTADDDDNFKHGQIPSSPAVCDTAVPEVKKAPPEVNFSDPRQNQVFQMLTGVQQLRKEGVFTDITVRVNDVDFSCHSFVLAINSPFLHAMVKDYNMLGGSERHPFDSIPNQGSCPGNIPNSCDQNKEKHTVGRSDLDQKEPGSFETLTTGRNSGKELHPPKTGTKVDSPPISDSNKEKGPLLLKGIKPEIFSKMLDFMYCCFEDVITEENCLELLLAADTMQLPHLRRTCATYVTDTLSAGNVFRVIQLCDSGYANLFEPRIMKRAHQVIRENFPQLSCAEEFLSLGRHVMIPLLADSMLHTRSEMDVLQALLKWVKAKPEERCSDMTLMLQHVRFPLMSSRELEKLREVPLLKQNSLAMALIEESRAYGNLDYNERMAWPRHNSISRCLFSTRDLILWTADRDKGLHFYSIIDGQHHKVTSFGQLTAPIHSNVASSVSTPSTAAITGSTGNFSFDSTSSVCCYGDKIFFTGGEFNTDMVWSVDTGSGEVKVHAKMPRGRKFHSMVASKGCVYCLGGQDKRGYTVLEDVDAYIINKNVWVKVGHLAVPAYNMSAAVSGGAVYLVGGLDHAGQPLRLIQCFIALRSGLYSAFKRDSSELIPTRKKSTSRLSNQFLNSLMRSSSVSKAMPPKWRFKGPNK